MIGEVAWSLKLSALLFSSQMPYEIILFFVRFAWAFLVLQYQALAFFLKSFTEKKFILNHYDTLLLFISSSLFLYYIGLALFGSWFIKVETYHLPISSSSMRSTFEIIMMHSTTLYILLLLLLPSLYSIVQKIRSGILPKILHQQILIIFKYFFIPFLIVELLIASRSIFSCIKPYTCAIVGISALLITYIVYYCIRHVMGLRFLNFTNHVEAKKSFNFVDDFKSILERLSFATTSQELIQITSVFFKQAFEIPQRKVFLYLHHPFIQDSKSSELDMCVQEYSTTIKNNPILIYDELLFSNFYEEENTRSRIIEFLHRINADIFIPILEKERIIGFIIIEANARLNHLYSNIERDEMLIFVSYLSNIINLLQHRNLESLIVQEKELKEELYKKEQEITQYKESIRSFLKNSKHKEIGIIFYKYRRFIYANQMAKEMLKINLNMQEGHPITRALKQIARQVEEYKSPQTQLIKDIHGNRFSVTGVSNLEQNNVILTISYPDIADIVTKQLSLLKDPSKWDYLLYLETTRPGQLINQLIPGNGQTLLNFKISLLQTALSKKATLLEIPQEDLLSMVELLHHISMREQLQTLTLQSSSNPTEIQTKLFGINPIFGTHTTQKPLLEILDGNGTLFIQNIDYLDRDSQEYLAEFIQYGYYRKYKSEHKISSSVRIICSCQQPLDALVQKGEFLTALFNELKKCSITLPSLLELPDRELNDLAQGYTEQILGSQDFKNLLELTQKERSKLNINRPVSLQELKTRVQHLLVQKSKKNNIEQEIQFDPAYDISDPNLIQASRLGKYALRDHKIMVTLWNKFKNQNKIAAFLGVNRSSVNRRCKEFNLEI